MLGIARHDTMFLRGCIRFYCILNRRYLGGARVDWWRESLEPEAYMRIDWVAKAFVKWEPIRFG